MAVYLIQSSMDKEKIKKIIDQILENNVGEEILNSELAYVHLTLALAYLQQVIEEDNATLQ